MDKRYDIFNAARDLFLQQGYKEVNVSDITKAAKVGVGTFYNYYPSKEELFLEIFIEENQKAKASILEALDINEKPLTLMRAFISKNKYLMNNNRILSEWYSFDKMRAYYQTKGEKTTLYIRDIFREFITKWRSQKKIRADIDNEAILSIFDLLVYLNNHQSDVDINNFEKASELLEDFFICGLVTD